MYSKTYLPYKGCFSSPFARWQGTLQHEHPVELSAATAKRWLNTRGFDPKMFDYLFLGLSVVPPPYVLCSSLGCSPDGC